VRLFKKIFFIFVFVFLFFPKEVSAKDFSSYYKTTYEFLNSGDAVVTHEISLVNKKDDLYVSQYSLSTVGAKISSIEAYDKLGPLKVKTTQKEKTILISLEFNDKVVGKDKAFSFILKYQSSDFAKKEGNLWQITIPKLADASDIDEYSLFLKIPNDFGKITYANPNFEKEEKDKNFSILTYSRDSLVNYGVLVTLGQFQTYDFNLKYLLENTSDSPVIENIALPPDTEFQTIVYDSLSPLPEKTEEDNDGNLIASYLLNPKEKKEIIASGSVNIFYNSKVQLNNESNIDKLQTYLEPEKYWEVNSPEIKSLAEKLKTPEKIFDYVSSKLSYDYEITADKIQRKGALNTLVNPEKSLCGDFTDLFVALSRAAGIPSREIVGYAFTDNPKLQLNENDILHSWPEYFDFEKNKWTSTDPTWTNTSGGLDYFKKFDMSHFAFAIHGVSSMIPSPAGSYKPEGYSEKTVSVTLSKKGLLSKESSLGIDSLFPEKILSVYNNKIKVQIRNENGSYLSINNILFKDNIKPIKEINENIKLLPFQTISVDLNYSPKEQFKDYYQKIIMVYGNNEKSINILVWSSFLRILFIVFIFILIAACLSFIITRIRIRRSKDKITSV